MTGDSVWLWQTHDDDDEWGAILAEVVPYLGPTVLLARDERTAELMEIFAMEHHHTTGHAVRCVRFDNPTVIRYTS